MEKIFKGLLLLLLMAPVIVKADMGAPETVSYDAVVIKENGADTYDFENNKVIKKGHLDKGTKVNVKYDNVRENVTYLFACHDGYENCLYVKSTDVMPEGEAIGPDHEGISKLKTPEEYLVVADEVIIREGPSASYKAVGTLKKGDTGTYSYYISSHTYVEKDGVKGWIETIGRTVLTKANGAIVVNEINTKCGKLAPNTILNEVWEASMWDGVSLIKYNGCEDYVETFHSLNVYLLGNEQETTTGTGKLYETAKIQKAVKTVPKGATVTILARYRGTAGPMPVYAEYNGEKGWFIEDQFIDIYKENYEEKPEKTPVDESDEDPIEEPVVEPNDEPVGDVAPKEEPEDNKKDSKGGLDTMTIVIMCCIGAAAIALTAIITIVLVNKKKKAVPTAAPTEEPVAETSVAETPTEEPAVEEVKEDK